MEFPALTLLRVRNRISFWQGRIVPAIIRDTIP